MRFKRFSTNLEDYNLIIISSFLKAYIFYFQLTDTINKEDGLAPLDPKRFCSINRPSDDGWLVCRSVCHNFPQKIYTFVHTPHLFTSYLVLLSRGKI